MDQASLIIICNCRAWAWFRTNIHGEFKEELVVRMNFPVGTWSKIIYRIYSVIEIFYKFVSSLVFMT